MKKSVFVVLSVLLLNLSGTAQNLDQNDVPGQVKKMFSHQFPKVDKYTWSLDKEKYVASFMVDKDKYMAIFAKDGSFLEKDQEIRSADLPKPIKESLRKDFPYVVISSALKTENPEKKVLYLLVVVKDQESLQLQYNPLGELLDKTVIEKPKEEKKTDNTGTVPKSADDKSKKSTPAGPKTQDKKTKDVKSTEPKTK